MFSRRSFLGNALTVGAGAFFLDPFRSLTEGIADSLIMQAHAEAIGASAARNYVNIQMPGAPIRYQFDHFLRTSAKDLAIAKIAATGRVNAMTCDSFTWDSKNNVTPQMKGFTYNNVIVPHLWSQSVMTSGGSQRPLTDLLKHMLVVRGFGSGLDGHQFNMLMQQAPIGGVSTLTGLVAENTKSAFDSVQYPNRGANGVFYSSLGKSQSRIAGTTPLTTLMEGFAKPSNLTTTNLKATHKEAVELARARLKAYARSSNAGARIVAQNLTNATDMMSKGVTGLTDIYNANLARYRKAILDSVRQSNIPGISEKTIVSDESLLWRIGTGDIIDISKDYDARTLVSAATIANLAESLATAEYLIKENLATAVDISATSFNGLTLRRKGNAGTETYNLGNDVHGTGGATIVLLMNAFYRGLTAGILEFASSLGPSLWANTVVQVQGDFGRTARTNGSGSDHGFNQMVTSAFSGAFSNGPVVVGNIKQGGHNSTYEGTQGIGAPIDGYNQKGIPTPVAASSTIASLLNTAHNPCANSASPLASLQNGLLTTSSPGKIVA